MAHHLNSPLARQDSRLNITNQYVFSGAYSTVFIMNTNTSLAGGRARGDFHPKGRYEFKIHLDGAVWENLMYRFAFGTPVSGRQPFVAYRLRGADASDDAATGQLVARGGTGEPVTGPDGTRVWAGRALDPFYLDLRLLKAVNGAVARSEKFSRGDHLMNAAESTFADSSISAIVLEVPYEDTDLHPGRHLGLWSTSKLATDAGGWRQTGRTGLPMIWPIFRADESEKASQANTTHPAADTGTYGPRIAELVTSTVARLGTSDDPAAYGRAVAARLLPDLLPYRVGSRASFGFGVTNGRALGDNAPEVMFSIALNTAISTGLTPAAGRRAAEFPYVVPLAD